MKVITWTGRGLTYALVSDLDERGMPVFSMRGSVQVYHLHPDESPAGF